MKFKNKWIENKTLPSHTEIRPPETKMKGLLGFILDNTRVGLPSSALSTFIFPLLKHKGLQAIMSEYKLKYIWNLKWVNRSRKNQMLSVILCSNQSHSLHASLLLPILHFKIILLCFFSISHYLWYNICVQLPRRQIPTQKIVQYTVICIITTVHTSKNTK